MARRPKPGALGLAAALLAASFLQAEEGALPTLRAELDVNAAAWFSSSNALIEPDPRYRNGLDFRRDYLDRDPILRFSLEYGGEAGLGVAAESTLRRQWDGDFSRSSNLFDFGGSGNPLALENKFFTRGLVYWRSPTLDLFFGRDQVDLNQGLRGGLLPSGRLPYYDALRAQGRLGRLTLDWMVATIQARRSWESYDGVVNGDVDPNAGLSSTMDPTLSEPKPYGWEDGPNPTIIAEAFHRFSWDFGSLSLGSSGHTMMARRNNRFVLTDFFPAISWHQAGVLQTNNSMVLDASWRPLPELLILAQAGFDDINGSSFGVGDTGAPTIDAYVLGARYAARRAEGALAAYAEAGYTQEYWGNYDGRDKQHDQNPFMRFLFRFPTDAGAALLPLTSPYGPGALWFLGSFEATWDRPGLRAGAEFLALAKTRCADLVNASYYEGPSPSGRITYFSLTLPLSWTWGSLRLSLRPAAAWIDGSFDGELGLALAWRYRRAAAIGRAPRVE